MPDPELISHSARGAGREVATLLHASYYGAIKMTISCQNRSSLSAVLSEMRTTSKNMNTGKKKKILQKETTINFVYVVFLFNLGTGGFPHHISSF